MHGFLPEVLYFYAALAALLYFGSFAALAHAARREGGENASWFVVAAYALLAALVFLTSNPSWRGVLATAIPAAGLVIAAWRIERMHDRADRVGRAARGAGTLSPSGAATVAPALALCLAVVALLLGIWLALDPVQRASWS